MLNKNSKIYIAGRNGLVGSSIERKLIEKGFNNIIGLSSKDLDLRNQNDVQNFFRSQTPDIVILAAAKVGGIKANTDFPAEFLYDNLMIQSNIINSAYLFNVKKLLFLGSSCIYPRLSPQPMKEEYLLDGKLEPTNEGYAIAKIAGLKLCEMYNKQYGTQYISVMPSNIYGVGDNFDSNNSHVVAALIKKFHFAKISSSPYVDVWGSGNARRELLYSDDLAEACVFLLEEYSETKFLNIGTGEDVSIRELANIIKEVTGYKGEIKYDISKPDGMPQKLLDVSKIHNLGWKHKTQLEEGIQRLYKWYLEQKF